MWLSWIMWFWSCYFLDQSGFVPHCETTLKRPLTLNFYFLGCRAGYIKLWSVESCALQGEMKAHNSTINTITTNNNHVFTGSNDGSIGMWRVRNHFDKSPDSEMSSSSWHLTSGGFLTPPVQFSSPVHHRRPSSSGAASSLLMSRSMTSSLTRLGPS